MEKFILDTEVIVLTYNELNSSQLKLVETAFKACENSYSPYSEFSVGHHWNLKTVKFFRLTIRKMPHTPQDCAPNAPCFFMPKQIILTKKLSAWS